MFVIAVPKGWREEHQEFKPILVVGSKDSLNTFVLDSLVVEVVAVIIVVAVNQLQFIGKWGILEEGRGWFIVLGIKPEPWVCYTYTVYPSLDKQF